MSQRTSSVVASAPPATGRTQCGYRCSRVGARLFSEMTSILATKIAYTRVRATEWIATRAFGVWKPRMKTQWKKTGIVQRIASRPDHRWTPLAVSKESGTIRCSLPHIRDAVSTWTHAKTTAAVANHALNAIVDENTVVTMSVYVFVTSKSGGRGSSAGACAPEHTRVSTLAAASLDRVRGYLDCAPIAPVWALQPLGAGVPAAVAAPHGGLPSGACPHDRRAGDGGRERGQATDR